MRIGILGSGIVGRTLGAGPIKHGHQVLGTREPNQEKVRDWAAKNADGVVTTFSDVAGFGDLLVLAVLGAAVEHVIELANPGHFRGKTLIDTTNRFRTLLPSTVLCRTSRVQTSCWQREFSECFRKRISSRHSTAWAVVAEYTRYRISKDRQEAFEKAYESAQGYLKASPNCISYELSHCTEEPDRYVLRIEWVSEERHLKGFRQELNFKKFFELVQPFVSNIEQMQHYELTEVVGRGGANPEARWVA